MKTIILLATLLILILLGGKMCLNIHTGHIARARMLLYLLGDRFHVQAKITPLWTIPERIGQNDYCARIYSVSLSVAK